MPPPDRMLHTLRRATESVRGTPGRVGHLLHLQDCADVLVAGDLHGHVPNFQVVMKAADLANQPRRHLVLQELIHSKYRYPNGGDRSHQLVDLFAALRCQFPGRVHYLPGNHELAQWTDRPVGKGDDEYNAMFVKGVEAAYGAAGAEVYAAYCDLFRALPVGIRTPNAVFLSHSLPAGRHMATFDPSKFGLEEYDPAEFVPGGFVYGVLWGRDTSDRNVDDYLRKVDSDLLVSGHIPTDEGYLVPNAKQLIVDCSASPASYVLFPADRPLTLQELVAGVVVF